MLKEAGLSRDGCLEDWVSKDFIILSYSDYQSYQDLKLPFTFLPLYLQTPHGAVLKNTGFK